MYDFTVIPTFKQFYEEKYQSIYGLDIEHLFEAINLYLALYMPLPRPS